MDMEFLFLSYMYCSYGNICLFLCYVSKQVRCFVELRSIIINIFHCNTYCSSYSLKNNNRYLKHIVLFKNMTIGLLILKLSYKIYNSKVM